MSWLKKHWRTLAALIAGSIVSVASQNTVAFKTASQVIPIINAIPCTPGEAGCSTPGQVRP
jgi:hypothetical protein